MATKKLYFETPHTIENDVVLVKSNHNSIAETYCFAFYKPNKKIKMPKFDGFYYNHELKALML